LIKFLDFAATSAWLPSCKFRFNYLARKKDRVDFDNENPIAGSDLPDKPLRILAQKGSTEINIMDVLKAMRDLVHCCFIPAKFQPSIA